MLQSGGKRKEREKVIERITYVCRSQWPRGLKAWSDFARSNAGIVGSNPSQGMEVCACVYSTSVGNGLATGWSPVHILLSQIRDFPNLEGQVPIFISPGNRVAQLYPQVLRSHFVSSYDSQGYGWGIRTRLHTGYHSPSSAIGYRTILIISSVSLRPRYIALVRTQQKTPFPNNLSLVACVFAAAGPCLRSRRLSMNVSSGSTIPNFWRNVSIWKIWRY
jgi:hypothetical protein